MSAYAAQNFACPRELHKAMPEPSVQLGALLYVTAVRRRLIFHTHALLSGVVGVDMEDVFADVSEVCLSSSLRSPV